MKIEFNINDWVEVKLTRYGQDIHYDDFQQHFEKLGWKYSPPLQDSEGWSKWQFWSFMQLFGPYISLVDPPFTNIRLIK